jgi:hypothetical protein
MEPTVQTDSTIPNTKPDITFRDNKNGTWMLIDVVISGDKNVIQQEPENILKYENRTSDIERMWNLNVKVIPVIIGATGTICKSVRQYLSYIPGKHEIKKLQKQPYWALHTNCGKC